MAFMTYLARRTKQFSTEVKKTSQHYRYKKEIGDYWLGKTIGRGASGRVKIGYHKQTGHKVAIKLIARSQLNSSHTSSRSAQRELAILQLLYHPHLVDLKQVLQDSLYVYFVMEYMEGGELFQILAEKGRFRENDARCLFYQMATGLAWCHDHQICHRDLKPENILLDKSKKRIKIADFGMAAMNSALKTSCGSPHYASPEIVMGKAYDGTKTDVWSLGVILFALLSGHLPFDDESMPRLLEKIKLGRYRPIPSSVSAEAKDLVRKMLVVDPSKRIKMNQLLCHPWLSSFGYKAPIRPLNDPTLIPAMVTDIMDLDGRVWETLRVLWHDWKPEHIAKALYATGPNLQKLTCQLLEQRTQRLEEEEWKHNYGNGSTVSLPVRPTCTMEDGATTIKNRSMHARHASDEVDSKCSSIATPYDSSISTVSCTRTLDMPTTPKTPTFHMGMRIPSCSSLKKKAWKSLSSEAENGDPCMIYPRLQENTVIHVPTPKCSTSSPIQKKHQHQWVYQENQLTLAKEEDVATVCNDSHLSEATTVTSSSVSTSAAIDTRPSYSALPSLSTVLTTIHQQETNSSTNSDDLPSKATQQLMDQLKQATGSSMLTFPSVEIIMASAPLDHWWSKAWDFVSSPWTKKQPAKVVEFDGYGRQEYELAGKIHQILKDHYQGKLSGRLYPNHQVIWHGSMKLPSSSRFWFLCHMIHENGRHFKVNMVWLQGDQNIWEQGTLALKETLNQYEKDAQMVMNANGW
ncbi:Pkinase-domain-containing protein [Hesseltinella vesiculosa]|uniref:Pkinase-domain-containing protein n=1 Tax=Hesseltinella vesiculosa TaxID=101127 RepID=A0A1X2GLT1_9FUNG|nr:Pkinase-domain-containing protein [Hesseltinella vesiculosa]